MLFVSRRDAFTIELLGRGNPGQRCHLETAEFGAWTSIATNQFSADGTVLFQETIAQGASHKCFRLVMP